MHVGCCADKLVHSCKGQSSESGTAHASMLLPDMLPPEKPNGLCRGTAGSSHDATACLCSRLLWNRDLLLDNGAAAGLFADGVRRVQGSQRSEGGNGVSCSHEISGTRGGSRRTGSAVSRPHSGDTVGAPEEPANPWRSQQPVQCVLPRPRNDTPRPPFVWRGRLLGGGRLPPVRRRQPS
jgi:hypothetical protein